MKYTLSQIGKTNPSVLGFVTGLFLCLLLFGTVYLWPQGTVTITAKSCNQAPSTCVDANKKDRLYVTAESSLNSDDAQIQITNADLRMVKKNIATATTQYPSRDVQLQCSGWNTTTAAESTANMTLRAIAGSGATGSVPYRLGILNTGGTEFVSFDGLNQRVGIGQTSPSQKLDVAGAMILEPIAAPTCGASAKGAQYFDSTANKMYYCNGTSWTDMTGGGGGSSLWTNSGTTDYLTTTTDSAAIGGTSASYKLDVTGNLRSTTDAYLATSSGNLEVGGTATARGKLYVKGSTTSQITADIQMVSGQTANPLVIESSTPANLFVVDTNGSITTAGNATFKSPSNSTTAFQVQNSTPTTVLDVDTTNSRVGIANAAPSYTLDVTGTANASVALISPVLKPASDSTTALQLQTSAGTNVLNVDTTNSRVGIGTTAPVGKLNIVSSSASDMIYIDMTPSTNGDSHIVLRNATGTKNLWFAGGSAAGSFNPLVQAGDAHIIFANASGVADSGGLFIGPWSASSKGLRVDGATGNVGIGTTSPGYPLEVNANIVAKGGGGTAAGNYLGLFKGTGSLPGYPNDSYPTIKTDYSYLYFSIGGVYSSYIDSGGTYNVKSSRNVKENFVQVNPQEVLAKINRLPMYEWNYKKQNPSIKHIAPIAEDFYALFGLGGDKKMISDIDPSGVALVGIQALSMKVSELTQQNHRLEERLDRLEKTVEALREKSER